MTMTPDERKQKAEEIKRKMGMTTGTEEKYSQSHPLVESYQILEKIMEFLSDCNNEAFTQLDKGQLKDPFVDETKLFAEAINFSERPFSNLEKRLADAGIFRTTKKTEIIQVDGIDTELETTSEEPIRIIVRPLHEYAKEWMRKRHPVNRKRVDEFIELARAARGGEFLSRSPPGTQTVQQGGGMAGGRIA